MYMYFKENVKFEPLVWNWYAWSHLISPLSAACNLVERYIKIMESYVRFPNIHIQAVKNPKLLGGPFIDLDIKYVDEVKNLLRITHEKNQDLINLHKVYKNFEKLVYQEATGGSLEKFYKKAPDELKGMIELVYDINNNVSIKIFEELLYEKYYNSTHQGISLSLIETDYRPFIMSTPRINTKEEVFLGIPFSNSLIDRLMLGQRDPVNVKQIIEELKLIEHSKKTFLKFFQSDPNPINLNRNYEGEKIRIRFFGHACILIQEKDSSILVDPVISYPVVGGQVRYTYKDLPDQIDYVLITHNHQDHVMLETLLQLRHKIKNIIVPRNHKGTLEDPSLKLALRYIGFNNIIEIENFDVVKIKNGQIMGCPFLGEHGDLNITSKIAYYISLKNKKCLLAADSNNLDPFLYDYLFSYIGKIDVLFLGMECQGAPLSWVYAPYFPEPLNKAYDEERTLSGSNFEKATILAEKSGCKEAYVYAMGMEPWLTYIMALQYSSDSLPIIESDKFVSWCKEKNILSERLFLQREWEI